MQAIHVVIHDCFCYGVGRLLFQKPQDDSRAHGGQVFDFDAAFWYAKRNQCLFFGIG